MSLIELPTVAEPFSPMESGLESSPAWYCVQTKQKHEHLAAAWFQNHLELEVFNPRLRMEKKTRRGLVKVNEALFPCYVFVKCSLGESHRPIQSTPGVRNLVQFNGMMPPVPDEVIESLRECFPDDMPLDIQRRFQPGTRVIIGSGVFQGYQAEILRDIPSRQRVQLLLEMLGRNIQVEVDNSILALEDENLAEHLPILARV